MEFINLTDADQQTLLRLARDSIRVYLITGKDILVNESCYNQALTQPAACYVTLDKQGRPRGRIGSPYTDRPLVINAAHHGRDAAFEDPRYSPVQQNEEAEIRISITVLSTPQPLVFNSETELLDQIAPATDGLILEEGVHRATLLPEDWQKLPDKFSFLDELRRKAGLNSNYWSDSMRLSRFHTSSFSE